MWAIKELGATLASGVLYILETWLQCFVILPVICVFEKLCRDLQFVVDNRPPSSRLSFLAQLILNYLDRDDETLRLNAAHRLESTLDGLMHHHPFSSPLRGRDDDTSWANDVLQQSWPHLAEFGANRVQLYLDTLLSDKSSSSSFIRRAKVTKLSLGSKPPSIVVLRVLPKISTSTGAEMVHLQIEFNWLSDVRCAITIQTLLPALGAMSADLIVSEVTVSGCLNVVLGPLVAAVPHFSKATAYFFSPPKISLKLKLLTDHLTGFVDADTDLTRTIGKALKGRLKSFALYPKFIELFGGKGK